jgi:type II secretory ATPase GspE/PulE/Tfp pilus assembly ATPase PilB-like protein/ActR/RegA family two-component response regulator
MADPEDTVAVEAIRFATQLQTERVLAPKSEIVAAIAAYMPPSATPDSVQRLLERLPAPDPLEVESILEPEYGIEPDEDMESSAVLRLVTSILGEAIRQRASSIHFEPQVRGLRVRYRIDGVLQTVADLPKHVQTACVARVKLVAGMDVSEHQRPQEGRTRVILHKRKLELQVNVLPTIHGEMLVLRVLDSHNVKVDLDGLGLLPRDLQNLAQVVGASQGIILCAGPSGSGKTSTLYSALARRNTSSDNVVTVEHPIECVVPGINQARLVSNVGVSFAQSLRAVLRQDPDVMMIGELRDHEAAEVALDAAQTGRLILSTMHTLDSVSAVTRLVQMGLPAYLVASSLVCVVGQRLVRRLCVHCRTETPASAEALTSLGYLGGATPSKTFSSRGCHHCNYVGFKGRVGVFELLLLTPRLRDLITRRATHSEILSVARSEGMRTLLEDGLEKVALGWTSIDELLRVAAPDRKGGRKCPKCQRGMEESFVVCPYCAEGASQRCLACSKVVDPDWQTCPYCRFALRSVPAEVLEFRVAADISPRLNVVSLLPTLKTEGLISAADDGEVILVIDDDEVVTDVLKDILEGEGGYQVLVAHDGDHGLSVAHTVRPRLILCDTTMPDLDGFEVVRRLRGQMRTGLIPIVLMMASGDGQESLAFQVGADDYLHKPIQVDRLLTRVGAVLRRAGVRA